MGAAVRGPAAAAVALLTIAPASLAAVEPRLSTQALLDAVSLGQSRLESVRTTFHRPYRIEISKAPVDRLEVVTPFRRVVLAAEAQAALGNRGFGQRDALAALGATPDATELIVDMTFHPLNTLARVPTYEIRLLARAARTPAVDPRSIEHTPRFGPPRRDSSGTALPLTGARIVATLDGSRLDPVGVYEVLLIENRAVIASVTIDFGKLR